jgi:hypothetical protein
MAKAAGTNMPTSSASFSRSVSLDPDEEFKSGVIARGVRWVNVLALGVGLDRVVREVHQHPEDHEFESQRWQ